MLLRQRQADRICARRCSAALTSLVPEGLCAACLLESGLDLAAEPAALPTLAEAAEGRHFGDYALLEEIARGVTPDNQRGLTSTATRIWRQIWFMVPIHAPSRKEAHYEPCEGPPGFGVRRQSGAATALWEEGGSRPRSSLISRMETGPTRAA